jgi:hypothetical protein
MRAGFRAYLTGNEKLAEKQVTRADGDRGAEGVRVDIQHRREWILRASGC